MSAISMLDILAIEKEGRRLGAIEALSRLREKVAQMQTDVDLGDQAAVLLDDVLALIDEEVR